jgi:type VI secretion system protein VasD
MTRLPSRPRRRLIVIGVLLAVAAVSGCATDKSAKTTPVKFDIQADQQVNPDANGQPTPVVVRVYELKSTTAFTQAAFFDLFDNDAKVLGSDLVAKREFEIKPGDRVDFDRDTPVETRYIGVTAAFRLGDDSQWRTTAEIKPEKNNTIVVKVAAQSISIEADAGKDWWKLF